MKRNSNPTHQDYKPVIFYWGPDSPHSEEVAKRLNAPMHFIHYQRLKIPILAPIKYLFMFLKTWRLLFREQPSVIYVINTPVFAPLCVYLYSLLTGTPFVMNVHERSFIGRKWGWAAPLQRFLAKRALANVLDHSGHNRIFESWGGKTIMLERPPFVLHQNGKSKPADPIPFTVTVINNLSGDEHLELVMEAAQYLPDTRFYILGDKSRASKNLLEQTPPNIIFTGYLLDHQYWDQLHSSNAIMNLTTTPYPLVSGGVEGMALGKPLILSRQPGLREYFTKGTIFVDHTIDSIIKGVRQARQQEEQLRGEISELSKEKQNRWNNAFGELVAVMGGQACRTSLISAFIQQT